MPSTVTAHDNEPDSATALLRELRDIQREALEVEKKNATLNRFTLLFLIWAGGLAIAIVASAGAIRILLIE